MDISVPTKSEIKDIVGIHKAAFPNFFLTSLGSDFLEIYYRAYLNTDGAILLCAKNNCEIVGFAASALYSRGFNKYLILQNKYSFLYYGIKLLLTRPRALFHLLMNIEKRKSVEYDTDYAELYSIAVNPNAQGQGVGRELLMEIENELKKRQIYSLSLTTDYDNNHKTLSFYKAMNFLILYEFITYPNRKMIRMIKYLE